MNTARVGECVHFGPARKLARLDLETKSYLCSVGFEKIQGGLAQAEVDNNPAFLTVVLAELQPRPAASIDSIREIIEWSDKHADPEYNGHDFTQVASLFPVIRVYALEKGQASVIWNTFFKVCVEECGFGTSWVEGRLTDALQTMCELDQDRIPYRVLCRSIFDGDRTSFFLALYRCLEALYAYSGAHGLAAALGISTHWSEIAAALEDQLGWHPREEGSLIRILKFASPADLNAILKATDNTPPPIEVELLVSHAAKAIYRLRNSIVHYRPAQHRVDMEDFDWISICEGMVGTIVDIYEAVFAGRSA